jgi:hypothetical protein
MSFLDFGFWPTSKIFDPYPNTMAGDVLVDSLTGNLKLGSSANIKIYQGIFSLTEE